MQREGDGIRNELTTAREATYKDFRNESEARAREAEALAACDNAWTELTQVLAV